MKTEDVILSLFKLALSGCCYYLVGSLENRFLALWVGLVGCLLFLNSARVIFFTFVGDKNKL